jgi:predicted GH43/DUF377 family glycosyl hydrolase
MEIVCLMNPGVFAFAGKTCLLVRVAERAIPVPGKVTVAVSGGDAGVRLIEIAEGDPGLDLSDQRIVRFEGRDYPSTLSHLRVLESVDGVEFSLAQGIGPLMGAGELEDLGIEDCRVSLLDGMYVLTFTAVSEHGVGGGLRTTRDWRTFNDLGMILPPHNKDCAVFEEKVGGVYMALHRPSSPEFGGNYIWLAESEDLVHWGNHRCVAHTRPGGWDGARIGAGAAPVKTTCGWLEVYHGATRENRYCLGLLLLDLAEPWKVLARSEAPVMEPEAEYELHGFVPNVIFSNGQAVDGDRLTVYYGAADTVICSAEFSIAALLGSLGFEGSRA